MERLSGKQYADADSLSSEDFACYKRGNFRQTENKITGIVVHTAGVLDDENQPGDTAAERVANYGASPGCKVSWHCVTDSDSIIWCLPEELTAWHAWGYNSNTLGIEIATSPKWFKSKTSRAWLEQNHKMYDNAALVVGYWCARFNVPVVLSNDKVHDMGERGIVYDSGIFGHDATTPYRKRHKRGAKVDPGKWFNWDAFMSMVNGHYKRFLYSAARPLTPELPTVKTVRNGKPAEDYYSSVEQLTSVNPLDCDQIRRLKSLLMMTNHEIAGLHRLVKVLK